MLSLSKSLSFRWLEDDSIGNTCDKGLYKGVAVQGLYVLLSYLSLWSLLKLRPVCSPQAEPLESEFQGFTRGLIIQR